MQQTHLAREANLASDMALLFGGQAGVAATQNFASVADETAQLRGALVIQSGDEFRVEALALGAQGPRRAAGAGH